MKLKCFIIIFLTGFVSFAQKNEYKVSSKDSIEALKFWKTIVVALNKGDAAFIQKNSTANVECYCGTDSATNEISSWKADKFAPQFIKKFNISPNLKKVIQNEDPKIMLSPINQNKNLKVFSVVYVVDKPSKHYEGTSIFFDIYRKGNSFRLRAIWTIP